MKRLTVKNFGAKVQGVTLYGDRSNPEPDHFRVAFPGGDVDVTRTTNDEYWIHIRVNTPEKCEFGSGVMGKLVDARLDISSKNASECDEGDFSHPDLYHLAVRIARDKEASG